MKMVKHIFNLIDSISDKAGKLLCYLIFLIMVISFTDVVARYVFNNPLLWGWLVNKQLFGVFILFAGIYTMSKQRHIRIEILYERFPPRLKLFARMIALLCFVTFMGVLVWQGAWMGWNSLMVGERAPGAFRLPLYPFKLLIPAAAFLFLLEGIVVYCRKEED
jgi:TRAP-type mannitol/chloroaromatic compound transport system permease small subunit